MRDVLCRCKGILRGSSSRRCCCIRQTAACIGPDQRDTPRKQVRKRGEVRHRWCLAAVERVLYGATPSACFHVNEVGYVARCNAQTQCMAFECGAVEELRIGPNGGHRCELVDGHLFRCLISEHGEESDGRVVVALTFGYATGSYYIENCVA